MLALLEAGLRLARVRYEASLYRPDPVRGYSLRPNASGWNVGENENYVHINSDGLRDYERPIARPSSTLRIAVLGSSEAEGRQVPLDKTFETVLAHRLDRELPQGRSADVLNFAVPGYTYSQHYLTLHNEVWKYDPQIVILALAIPAVFKNTRELYWGGDTLGTPFYELHDGQLVPDRQTRETPPPSARRVYWKNTSSDWMNRFVLLSLLNKARIELQALPSTWTKTAATAAATGIPSDYVSRWTYQPDLPEVQTAWAIGEAFVELMQQDCARHGAEFWIVSVDQLMQSNPNLAEREKFLSETHIASLGASDQRIQRFGDAHGIPVILLAPPMGDYAASHGVALHGFAHSPFNSGHWNELGHEVAGGVVAQELLARSAAVHKWIAPKP